VQQHGFKLKKMIAMPFDAFYICLLSEKYKYGKNHYLNGFINGSRSWINGNKVVKESSSILYILCK
ncbi:MAG: class I SAM-dependent methyltransferase, partial [Chitinophagaceae bacterium]